MYTSYSGMRSTGGAAAPSGSTFKRWVLAETPSLKTLMHPLVGIVVEVLAARPLLGEPGIEARGDEPIRALLALGGADGAMIGVLVLGIVGVAAHPGPRDRVARGRLHQLLPQRQVLHGAPFAAPAPRLPPGHPRVHPLDEILGVGYVGDPGVAPLTVQPLERGDGAGERHTVVGRVRRAFVEVPTRHTV